MASSVPEIDLLKEAAQGGQKDTYNTLVAVFKEPSPTPRVLADSESYLAYSLRNGRTLRVVQRADNMRGTVRAHANSVHAMKFVNYRSNVAASAAENEFLVWVVTNENSPSAEPLSSWLTVKIYFKLVDPVTVGNFAFFINAQVGIFDILILYGKKAAVLESSKVIPRYTYEPLEAKLSSDSRELRELPQEATTKSLCSINNSGWFAFSVDSTLVAACTMRNRSTPAWEGCQGAPVLALALLDLKSVDEPTLLMTCSTTRCFQWELTGDSEPKLLRTFTFGNNIITMLSSRSTFAVFNDDERVVLVDADGRDTYTATAYNIQHNVRAGSVCFNRKTSYGNVLSDKQTQVEMFQLAMPRGKDGANAHSTNTATTAAISSPTAANESSKAEDEEKTKPTAAEEPTNAASPVLDPAIISVSKEVPAPAPATATTTSAHVRNLMEQVQRGNVRATPPSVPPPPSSATTTTAEAATASANATSASAAARALLQNTALPQGLDGPLASATHASDEAVRRELEGLHNLSKSIAQILQLTPDQIARDHEQLVNLALEAQMTELQQQQRQSTAAGASGNASSSSTNGAASPVSATAAAARDTNAEAFNSYAVVKLLAPIANDIARGVTIGIRNTLRTELDNAIRDALGSSVRESQKRALKRRLDDVLQDSTAHFSDTVHQRLADFANRDLKDVFAQVNASTNALVEENRRLQASLNDIVRCGVLEQLQATQKELQQLKEDLKSGGLVAAGGGPSALGANPSAFQGARPNPETILTTARTMLVDEGNARGALEYIAMARQPSLTLRLLKPLHGGDAYYAMVADDSITDDLWLDVLMQVSTASAMESTGTGADDDARFIAELLLDVVCERDTLTTLKSAKAQGLMSNIRHFIMRQKQSMTDGEGQKVLRDLEKSIQ